MHSHGQEVRDRHGNGCYSSLLREVHGATGTHLQNHYQDKNEEPQAEAIATSGQPHIPHASKPKQTIVSSYETKIDRPRAKQDVQIDQIQLRLCESRLQPSLVTTKVTATIVVDLI